MTSSRHDTSDAARRPAPLAVVLAFACVYVIWGLTYLAIRVAVQTLPPLTMAGVRFVVAGGLMYAWLWARGTPPPTWTHWRSAALVGGLMLLGGNGGVVWAETLVHSGIAALLVATVPLWLVLLNAVRPGGVRPNGAEVGGLVLGFAGVWALVRPAAASAEQAVHPVGAGLLLFASLSWAVGSLYSRHAPLPKSALLGTAMEMLAGGGLLLVGGGVSGEWARLEWTRFSLPSLAALVYLIVFGSLIAFTAYIWLLRVCTPAQVGTYAYVNPGVAVFCGWAVLNEPVSSATFAALVLIMLAVVLITKYGRRAPAQEARVSQIRRTDAMPSSRADARREPADG